MRLGTKLAIMSIFTILIPIMIIVVFSVFMIYRSSAITQLEYLEDVNRNIIKDILETEDVYLRVIKTIADEDLVRDKLYVYEKYWTRLSERLRTYDAQSLISYIENTARDNNIEVIAVYRRDGESFLPVALSGKDEHLPQVLYKENIQQDYSRAKYRSYSDGIYLEMVYPVFSDGRLVGIVQFIRGLNKSYLEKYGEIYDIDYALLNGESIYFNSRPTTSEAMLNSHEGVSDAERFSFRAGSGKYYGIFYPFKLGGNTAGTLVLYSERLNVFGGDSFIVQRLLAVTLLCIMIPVITFVIKETRLIRSINSLLAATDDISSGNYSSRLSVVSNDELGLLTGNFNKMVDVLKKNRNDLESRNEELLLKNSYIDAVFQSLRINIIVIDPESRIRVVSKNTGSRLELTEEHYGRMLLDVEPFKSSAERLEKPLWDILKNRKFTRLQSLRFDNTSYEIDFYPVLAEDGGFDACVIVLNNITERMNMERALIQSDRLASVGKMAAGLAHEINNPMSIILNHVQLLQSDKLSAEERARFINRVESEIKRVNRLIKSLLKFSHDEKAKPEQVALGEILAEVLGLFDPKMEYSRVSGFYTGRTDCDLEADFFSLCFRERSFRFYATRRMSGSVIVCERDSLKQIIFNLVKNAFESCERNCGIIWADSEKLPDSTVLRLTDNGCGIAGDELSNVFELFYTKGKPGTGVGLGLPLCKKLMDSQGGEIHIESNEGLGTVVLLSFPDRREFI